MAGVAACADSLLIEVRPNPSAALTDAEQSFTPVQFANLVHLVEALFRNRSALRLAE